MRNLFDRNILVYLILVLTAFVGWIVLSEIRVSYTNGIQAEFDAMPADDLNLENWLKVQPGIVPNTVHLHREGKSLEVWFMQSRSVVNPQPIPNVAATCEELGYKFRSPGFHDIPPR